MQPERDETTPEDVRVVPERDDQGKDVVGAAGRAVGMVTTVAGGTMYVAPNTALSEAVERKLGWDGGRHTDLPVPAALVARIDDEVVLAVERDDPGGRGVE